MTQNAQTDLAEIKLAILVQQKGTTTQARSLAQRTSSDHQQALTKLRSLARTLNVTLPSVPNAQQRSMASALSAQSGSAFDISYLKGQVAGHEQSIAQTETELSSGSDSQVVAFAKSYLPIAQMHLADAQRDLRQLTGVPSGVNTGSGGLAATASGASPVGIGLAGGGAALITLAIAVLVRRRRLG